jgi:hypothetical protein
MRKCVSATYLTQLKYNTQRKHGLPESKKGQVLSDFGRLSTSAKLSAYGRDGASV